MSKLQYQNYIDNYFIKSKAKAGKKQRAKVKDWTRGNGRTKKVKAKKQTGGNRPLWLMKILK